MTLGSGSLLKLGTRGSQLALAQTDLVLRSIAGTIPGQPCDTVVIQTSGDWKPSQGETRLAEAQGGKGLFIKEIEQALMAGQIDCGVHSLKDVPSFLPEGFAVDHVLPRADPRDIFITRLSGDIYTLPTGASVGTSSLRRLALISQIRPDLLVVPLRGNVPTRLDKLRAGQVDAIVLANAGLSRLGMAVLPLRDLSATLLEPEIMLPACGQGIIGVETRLRDGAIRSILDRIHDGPTGLVAAAERRVLQVLDGSCHTPIGAYAVLSGDVMEIRALVAAPDGKMVVTGSVRDTVRGIADAQAAGDRLGQDIRQRAPAGVLPHAA